MQPWQAVFKAALRVLEMGGYTTATCMEFRISATTLAL